MALSDEKCILFTTFRRDGSPVATPVWIVPIDEKTFGFWTSSGSGKVKRLAHTDRVTIQPCNQRGVIKPGSRSTSASARLVSGAELQQIQTKIVAKYGIMTKIAKLLGTLIGTLKGNRVPYGDRGVIISLA
jgi:hypothetical protein